MEGELTQLLSGMDYEFPKWDSNLDVYTKTTPLQPLLPTSSKTVEPLPSTSARFSNFKSDQEVEEAKKLATAKNTVKSTTWAMKVWTDWTANRQKSFPGHITEWPIHPYLALTE